MPQAMNQNLIDSSKYFLTQQQYSFYRTNYMKGVVQKELPLGWEIHQATECGNITSMNTLSPAQVLDEGKII